MPAKKKRSRPRKYPQDGSVTLALSPKPLSSSAPPPPVIDFTAEKSAKAQPPSSVSKAKFEVDNTGVRVTRSGGAPFIPHFITIYPGEDIFMKIKLISELGPRSLCILSATGIISRATLRQPCSSGSTYTIEGQFPIISLCGSFMPVERGRTGATANGMTIMLAMADEYVVGAVDGELLAASPVQLVVGSFLAR